MSSSTSTSGWPPVCDEASVSSEPSKIFTDVACKEQLSQQYHHCNGKTIISPNSVNPNSTRATEEISPSGGLHADDGVKVQTQKPTIAPIDFGLGNIQPEISVQDEDDELMLNQKIHIDFRDSAHGTHPKIKDDTDTKSVGSDIAVSNVAVDGSTDEENWNNDHPIFSWNYLELWAKARAKCLIDQYNELLTHTSEDKIAGALEQAMSEFHDWVNEGILEGYFMLPPLEVGMSSSTTTLPDSRKPENVLPNSNPKGVSDLPSVPEFTGAPTQDHLPPIPRIARPVLYTPSSRQSATLPRPDRQVKPIRQPANPPLNTTGCSKSSKPPPSQRSSPSDLVLCPAPDRLLDDSKPVFHILGTDPEHRQRVDLQESEDLQRSKDSQRREELVRSEELLWQELRRKFEDNVRRITLQHDYEVQQPSNGPSQAQNSPTPHEPYLHRKTPQQNLSPTVATAVGTPQTQCLIQKIHETCNSTPRTPARTPTSPRSGTQTPNPEASLSPTGRRIDASSKPSEEFTRRVDGTWRPQDLDWYFGKLGRN